MALRGLCVTRYSEPQNISALLLGGLESLQITDMNIEKNCEWPSRLIALNRDTLRRLRIGVMNKVAQDYATNNLPSRHQLPASFATHFAEVAKEPSSEDGIMRLPRLSLHILCVYGLGLANVIRGLDIDFSKINTLSLESCFGLQDLFAVLMSNSGSQTAFRSNVKLRNLFIRHEGGDQVFTHHLAAFLTSFTGLSHLTLLLEGPSQAMDKAPILKKHGKTLKTLVWDERRRARQSTNTDNSLFLNQSNQLGVIFTKCPNLRALGLPVP